MYITPRSGLSLVPWSSLSNGTRNGDLIRLYAYERSAIWVGRRPYGRNRLELERFLLLWHYKS